jgi:hypothetical protein
MLGELRSEVLDELLVMRYLKVHKKFDSSDFILGLNNMEDNHIAGFVEKAAEETEPEYLRLYTLLALYAGEPERIDKALDETPEKAAIIIERCKRRLAMLRNIPASSPEADDRRHYNHTALYAAGFVAGRTSCWNGLKPLLLAFRRADTALLEPDLRPAGGIEENIAAQIDRFLRWDWGDEKMKNLRRDMANDLSNYLKPRKIRAGDVTGQRNGGPEYGGYERGLEGFDRKLTEPNPLWRYAYVRALGDLAVDSGGNGRLIHNTLDKTAENDPAPPVREGAKKTAEQLRRIRGGYETDFHNRCLLQAFWWMCRAHLQTLGIPFDEAVALKTRNTEYR